MSLRQIVSRHFNSSPFATALLSFARAATIATLLVFLLAFAAQDLAIASETPGYEVVTKGRLKPGSPIPAPKGDVILTVKGATSSSAKSGVLQFDRAGLEAIGLIRFSSKNRWYDNPLTYEGVLGSRLMQIIGVPKGSKFILLKALNDYAARIPISDFSRWPVMFALKLDGKYMTVREKGPIWVVYPNHLFPELGKQPHSGKWIWQLKSIEFK